MSQMPRDALGFLRILQVLRDSCENLRDFYENLKDSWKILRDS